MTEPIRLTKYLTTTTTYSRREAEILVIDGWVRVNGVVIDRPQHMVSSSDSIVVDPCATFTQSAPVTILLHKPSGYSNQLNSSHTVWSLFVEDNHMPYDRSQLCLQHKHLRNLNCVYELDELASGLAVYTQDQSLARKLSNPHNVVEHEYVVGVDGTIAPGGLAELNNPKTLSLVKKPSLKVSWQNETHLRIAGKGLQKGDIATLCARVDLTVISIKRLRIGRIPLGQLTATQWRFLLAHERF